MSAGQIAKPSAATIERLRADAVALASAGLAARLAVEAPDVAVTAGDGEVRLVAPGLVARVFGSRRRGPDPRLSALMGGNR